MNKNSNSSHEMLSWQLKTLLGEIQQIELHETGDCPCILNTENPPERCLGKHLLNISTLSQETASMDSQNEVWLHKLAKEANERHEQFKEFICHKEDLPELAEWARNWRKQNIEPIYYTCKINPHHKATLQDANAKGGKQTRSLKSTANELTSNANLPATSCSIREAQKN